MVTFLHQNVLIYICMGMDLWTGEVVVMLYKCINDNISARLVFNMYLLDC